MKHKPFIQKNSIKIAKKLGFWFFSDKKKLPNLPIFSQKGNFGIVFRGGLTHSNEEWEEVAVKLLKDVNDQGEKIEIKFFYLTKFLRSLFHDFFVIYT